MLLHPWHGIPGAAAESVWGVFSPTLVEAAPVTPVPGNWCFSTEVRGSNPFQNSPPAFLSSQVY